MSIPTPEKRIAAFEQFGFGMFVHWGLYSRLGRGEWVQYREKIPCAEYEKLANTFTASGFDARRWVAMAKAAGAKYITLTARHHEGFSLYDTCGLSDYDVMHTPCGRDLIKEFVDACHEGGIAPFFYHTTLDWHHPDFNGDFKAYLRYLRASVELLCTNYGKIGGLWFDGNWSRPGEDWEEDALYAVIRKHQPDAIIINNTGLGARGELGNFQLDSVTFEQGRPTPLDREGAPKYVAAEMCHTINYHWGHGAKDLCCKSLPELIETLCACRKVGANYLLNVGPRAEGDIAPLQEALMRGIGEWIESTGGVIYAAKPCGITGEDKNFGLREGDTYYLFVHGLATGGTGLGGDQGIRHFKGIPGTVRSVRWTDNGEDLSFTQEDETLSVSCTPFPYGTNLVVRVAEVSLA